MKECTVNHKSGRGCFIENKQDLVSGAGCGHWPRPVKEELSLHSSHLISSEGRRKEVLDCLGLFLERVAIN